MVGPGIWRETLKNLQNEKHTKQDLDYGKKTEKNMANETQKLCDLEHVKKH